MKYLMSCILLLLFLFYTAISHSGGNLLPDQLRLYAEKSGCTQLENFYDRPGRINPMYVYGYVKDQRDPFGEYSAVFWCKKEQEREPYRLIIWLGRWLNTSNTFSCPKEIMWQNYPGGLSILWNKKLSLNDFWYRENPKKKGPSGLYTNGPIIHSTYDGAGANYYCHEGKWLCQQFH